MASTSASSGKGLAGLRSDKSVEGKKHKLELIERLGELEDELE